MSPLVSVICLCHNHERFINDALRSVLSQTYSPVEIIIIDDASTDASKNIILNYLVSHPHIQALFNESNIGNCSSFNKALKLAKGEYIIDFATDDIMKPNKIERQVEVFEKLDESYGVVFSNALNITEGSDPIRKHFQEKDFVPEGFIYTEVLKRFFIPATTIMVRKKVLDDLGGYDETLSYEDFDFWVRSSNRFRYCYINEVLMHRRVVKKSLSANFLQKSQKKMLESSYRVCEKALWLNTNKEENKALIQRLNIEMRLAFFMENFVLVRKYKEILDSLNARSVHSFIIYHLADLNIRVYGLYKWYLPKTQ